MVVKRNEFDDVVAYLSRSRQYSLDTESSGLSLSDRLFSIIIASESGVYYFNFQSYEGLPYYCTLSRSQLEDMEGIFSNPESTWFMHNAKFDMMMLAKEGLEIKGTIHCTQSIERVLKNNYLGHKPYSLAACAARRGMKKDEAVEEYIKKNGLITKVDIPGKKKKEERWHFDRVPFHVIQPYGEKDAMITLALGKDQCAKIAIINKESESTRAPSLGPLINNEYALTKVCHEIEKTGIKIDRGYTEKALNYAQALLDVAKESFKKETGETYQASPLLLTKVFRAAGVELPKTDKGRDSTAAKVLDELDHPLAERVREIRSHEKLISTYFSSFIYFADSNDLIHANIRQAGTETGRFSYSEPNLQNLPKEDEADDRGKPFLVRKCFIPRMAHNVFVDLDYSQQEFRLMLDYAGEKEMIEAVNYGVDVHEATASLLGVSRKTAKTLNFGLLYGMGAAKLAKALRITLAEAQEQRANYFAKLPRVRSLINTVMDVGVKRGYIFNWFGFRNYISDPEFAYILPNHLIQGSGAQVLRVALVRVHNFIRSECLDSRIVLQVHDSITLEMPEEELGYIAPIREILESVYQPKNGLRLTCSVETSRKSLAKWDMEKFDGV